VDAGGAELAKFCGRASEEVTQAQPLVDAVYTFAYRRVRQGSPRRPTLVKLSDIVRHAAVNYFSVLVVVNALEKCERAEWTQLHAQFWHLRGQMPNVKLLATLRPQLYFKEKHLVTQPSSKLVSIQSM
jgi:hypothetical protein